MSANETWTYSQGHHRAVTANHKRRTAEVDGAFVLPYLEKKFRILDLGCGPGTITAGFAKYVPEGSVVGVDLSPDVLQQANEHMATLDPKPSNVSFQTGNVLSGLPFHDGEFDVVFCNQTLLHIPDALAAMKEMKRVCNKTGLVACREADWPFRCYPYLEGISLWHKYAYYMVFGVPESSSSSSSSTSTASQPAWSPAHPDNAPHPPGYRSGSMIHVWARKAGFDPLRIVKRGSMAVMSSPEEREFHATAMISRLEEGGHRERYRKVGATDQEVDVMVKDLRTWAEDVDGWYAIPQCEVVCWNS